MPITYREAKQLLAQFAGRGGFCADDNETNLFVRQVLEKCLYSGEYGNIKKFSFWAHKGCFTLPWELEVPLKVKVEDCVGFVFDRWFQFHDSHELSDCLPAGTSISEDPNQYPIVYDIVKPSRVGVVGTCEEGEDANVIVEGIGADGREIFTWHKGEQVKGERLSIIKNDLRYTETTFSVVTKVSKSITKGYVPLYAYDPATTFKMLLADYSPLDTIPLYRRYRLLSSRCPEFLKVTILGRIRLKDVYVDEDLLPFDTRLTLSLAGQQIQSSYNRQYQDAAAADAQFSAIINNKNEFMRIPSQPINVSKMTSAGRVRNIIGGVGTMWGWWR